MITPHISAEELLALIRDELVAQRAMQFHIIDLVTLIGGPDRDQVADHLERLFLPGDTPAGDVRAMAHLAGIASQLRLSGRGNLSKMRQ